MDKSEMAWAKEHGLKRTNLVTYEARYPRRRIVYRAADGKLYYRDRNQYVGTFVEYCEEV